MRIVENGPERLVLRDRSIWITAVCLAACVAAVAFAIRHGIAVTPMIPAALFAVFGAAFFNLTDVTFDKAEGLCRMRRMTALGIRRVTLAFDRIDDVRVEIMISSESHATMARLALVSEGKTIPLTNGYTPDFARQESMRAAAISLVKGPGAVVETVDPVEQLVLRRRLIDAISLLREREGLDLTTAHDRVTALAKSLAERPDAER